MGGELPQVGELPVRTTGYWVLRQTSNPFSFTGTAVWAVQEDGKLLYNLVERNSLELF
jgi:hypothetical protein